LRNELKQHERRLKTLEERETNRGSLKRRRSEDLRTSNKRLRSAVTVVGRTEHSSDSNTTQAEANGASSQDTNKTVNDTGQLTAALPRPDEAKQSTLRQSSEDKKRNRRLFGSLLLGTLSSFKKQVETEAHTLQQRKEVEKQTEDRVSAEHQRYVEEQQRKLQEEISNYKERVSQVLGKIKAKEEGLIKMKAAVHAGLLSNFLVTKQAQPAIYYFPAKCDEFTEKTLGTNPVPPEPKVSVPVSLGSEIVGDISNVSTADVTSTTAATTTTTTTTTTTITTEGRTQPANNKEEETKQEDQSKGQQAESAATTERKVDSEIDKEDVLVVEEVGTRKEELNVSNDEDDEELAEGVTPHKTK